MAEYRWSVYTRINTEGTDPASVAFDAVKQGAEEGAEDPVAAEDGAGAEGVGGDDVDGAEAENAAAGTVGGEGDAAEVFAVDLGESVVACEGLVDEGVVGIDEGGEGAVVAEDGVDEGDGLGVEGVALDHHGGGVGADGHPGYGVQQVHPDAPATGLGDGVRERALDVLVPHPQQDLPGFDLEHVVSSSIPPPGAGGRAPPASAPVPLLPISASPAGDNRDLGPGAGGPSARAGTKRSCPH